MILCNKKCIPCCDYCIYVIHDEWDEYVDYWVNPKHVVGGPIWCKLHQDKKHQEIVKSCGSCDDFHCCNAKEESWYIV